MQRLDGNFGQAAGPLTMPGQDPSINSGTMIANITTVDMGNGVLQRSINLTAASGTITLNETPLGGTLVVYQGTVVLQPSGYSVSGNTITFPLALSGITLSYQTSSYPTSRSPKSISGRAARTAAGIAGFCSPSFMWIGLDVNNSSHQIVSTQGNPRWVAHL
jgi:hypothetical protein